MLRDILIMFLLVAACCGAPQSPDAGPPDPVIDDPRSVLIKKFCSDDTVWYGTGHIVGGETVATAGHVIMCSTKGDEGPYDIEPVRLELNGANITGLEKVNDVNLDLGFIHYYNQYDDLPLGHVAAGDRVCIYPAVPKRGQVCGVVVSNTTGHVGLVMLLNVVPGNSGSVIFNDKNEIVGVVTSRDYIFGYGTSFDTIL